MNERADIRRLCAAAFKKYVLVSLIGGGVLPPFPRYTAPAVQRHLKAACAEYVALSDAYKTRNGKGRVIHSSFVVHVSASAG